MMCVTPAVCAAVRVAAFLVLVRRLLSCRKPGKAGLAAALSGAAAISAGGAFAGLSDVYRIVLEAVWITACASRLQQADTRMSLFAGIFYEMAVSFWEFLAASWLGVLFHSQAFTDCTQPAGQAAPWLVSLFLACLAVYASRHADITGREAFRAASAAAVAGFIAVITLSGQDVPAAADDTLQMWTVLSVVLMMSVLVLNMNRQYEAEKELAALKTAQAELLERDYTALNNAYALNARLFHDFHNHIGVLRQYLSQQKYEKAVQYLDALQAPAREMADTAWTGDETADYLINSKAAQARADGIQMQVEAEYPRNASIRSADLCAILGNLLDNAIEAARQVPDPQQRFVRLAVRRIHQMIVIKAENSFFVQPVREQGQLKTTKDKGGLHGWGLKSAQAAAEKYDGMIQASCSGNVFRAVATLSFEGVKTQSD